MPNAGVCATYDITCQPVLHQLSTFLQCWHQHTMQQSAAACAAPVTRYLGQHLSAKAFVQYYAVNEQQLYGGGLLARSYPLY